MYTQKRAVWRTTNGSAWQMMVGSAAWSARYGCEWFSFNDSLYIAGGWNGYIANGDIWSSGDNELTWRKSNELPAYYQMGLINFGVAIDRGFLRFVGGTGTNFMDWMNYDSVYCGWNINSLVNEGAWLPPSISPCLCVYGDSLWLLGGAQKTNLWSCRKGSWRAEVDSCTIAPYAAGTLQLNGNSMWIFADNGTWLSQNRGKSWTKVQQMPPWVGCKTIRIYNFNGAFWLVSDKGIWHYDAGL